MIERYETVMPEENLDVTGVPVRFKNYISIIPEKQKDI